MLAMVKAFRKVSRALTVVRGNSASKGTKGHTDNKPIQANAGHKGTNGTKGINGVSWVRCIWGW